MKGKDSFNRLVQLKINSNGDIRFGKGHISSICPSSIFHLLDNGKKDIKTSVFKKSKRLIKPESPLKIYKNY